MADTLRGIKAMRSAIGSDRMAGYTGRRAFAVSVIGLMLLMSMGFVGASALADVVTAPFEDGDGFSGDYGTETVVVDKSKVSQDNDMVTFAACVNDLSTSGYHYISGNIVWDGGTCEFRRAIYIYSGSSLTLNGVTLTFNGTSVYLYNYNYGTFKLYNSTMKGTAGKMWNWYHFGSSRAYMDSSIMTDAYYYASYCSGCTSIYMSHTSVKGNYYGFYTWSAGWVAIDNSTFDGFTYYGAYMGSGSNWPIMNNTFKNCGNAGLYIYSGSHRLYDNKIINNAMYGMYIYYSAPKMANNTISGNNQAGIYIYECSMTIENNKIKNNNMADIWVESWSQNSVVKLINTRVNKIIVDMNSYGSAKSEVQVYWYANVSVRWLLDDSPVKGADLEIFDKDFILLNDELQTNDYGQILNTPIMEYKITAKGTEIVTPHLFNVTANVGPLKFFNSTEHEISDGVNNVELKLDNIPPPLTITNPTEGMIINTSTILIEGRTEPNTKPLTRPVTIEIEVNNGLEYEPFVDIYGYFCQAVKILREGPNNIEIKAFDWVMNQVKSEVNFTLDTKMPPLTLEKPEEGILINVTTIDVAGTAEIGSRVYVNGVQTTVSSEDGRYLYKLDLREGINDIKVEAFDLANNSMNKTSWVEVDTISPPLTITEPYDGMVTNQHNIKVLGITEPNVIVSLGLNPVLLAGSNYQTSTSIDRGENIITVRATDKAGNYNVTSVTVIVDDEPPLLSVDEPANNILIDTDVVIVSGFSDDDATLTVNNAHVKVQNGMFSQQVYLKEGENKILIQARDSVGNKITATKTVTVDTISPVLVIDSPEKGLVTTNREIVIEGSTEIDAKLTLNGNKMTHSKGLFSNAYTLLEGENVLEFEAKDEVGNSRKVVRTVHLDTIVDFILTSPMNNTTVDTKNVTFEGKVESGGEVVIGKHRVNTRSDGTFKQHYDLAYGRNDIKIVAKDDLNNKIEMMFVVTSTSIEAKEEDTTDYGETEDQSLLMGDNLNMLYMFILIVVGLVTVAGVGQAVISRDRRRITAEQTELEAAAQKDSGDTGYQEQYDAIYAETAAAVFSGEVQIRTRGSGVLAIPEEKMQSYPIDDYSRRDLQMAMMAGAEVENRGGDSSEIRRLLRLSHGLAEKGDGEKVTVYSKKVIKLAALQGVEFEAE